MRSEPLGGDTDCAAVKATVGVVRTSSNKYELSGARGGKHASVQESCIRVYASA